MNPGALADGPLEKPDPVQLATSLGHELEEARQEIETLKASNRELGMLTRRAEASRDALKELLHELWDRR